MHSGSVVQKAVARLKIKKNAAVIGLDMQDLKILIAAAGVSSEFNFPPSPHDRATSAKRSKRSGRATSPLQVTVSEDDGDEVLLTEEEEDEDAGNHSQHSNEENNRD